jgi:UPF0271 protein
MSQRSRYKINCDLGEGIPDEALIIPMIDLGSVACGGHFGDRSSIQTTLDLIQTHGKSAGAHPSYPDRANFGRKSLDISPKDLVASLSDQIGLFSDMAQAANLSVDHIKFHGALYNDAAENADLAELLLEFLERNYANVPLLVPPFSQLEKAALAKNHPIRLEIFGDRAYQDDYRLLSRKAENSLLTHLEQVVSHLDAVFSNGLLRTVSGQTLPIHADSICFHGDNPGILGFLPQVRQRYWT